MGRVISLFIEIFSDETVYKIWRRVKNIIQFIVITLHRACWLAGCPSVILNVKIKQIIQVTSSIQTNVIKFMFIYI